MQLVRKINQSGLSNSAKAYHPLAIRSHYIAFVKNEKLLSLLDLYTNEVSQTRSKKKVLFYIFYFSKRKKFYMLITIQLLVSNFQIIRKIFFYAHVALIAFSFGVLKEFLKVTCNNKSVKKNLSSTYFFRWVSKWI